MTAFSKDVIIFNPAVISKGDKDDITSQQASYNIENAIHSWNAPQFDLEKLRQGNMKDLAEILFITPYPPRKCGLATYSRDLLKALNNKFSNSLSIVVCALESGEGSYSYPQEVKYVLNTSIAADYAKLATTINMDVHVKILLIQHEFDFYKEQEQLFLQFLYEISKPIVIVFHTVLAHPNESLKSNIVNIAAVCDSIIVMTESSAAILTNDYGLPQQKISVIAHGTHLFPQLNKELLKKKYGLVGRKILSTCGLLSPGNSIETTIDALLAIIKQFPEVIFLIIGKTHPKALKTEGEKYRKKLEEKINLFKLKHHVKFINNHLALPDLNEYLQLTDIFLVTSKDPDQVIDDTFAYAMSCACPIISTPIPHAIEVLSEDTGIIFDFQNSQQLSEAVIHLLNNEPLRANFSSNVMRKIVSTSWENSAILHTMLFEKISCGKISIKHNLPEVNLNHLKQMTTNTGTIRLSIRNQPDIESGYTLDDNAQALIAMCMHYKLTGDNKDVHAIQQYLMFIKHCLQPGGDFLNYVDKDNKFTDQNKTADLDDTNGRAIWALGYLVSFIGKLPYEPISEAITILKKSLPHIGMVHSLRAMAFAIKGLYHYHNNIKSPQNLVLIKTLADRLVKMYMQQSDSSLPEAMLYAWLLTGDKVYKDVALSSFDFLLSQIFNENDIEVISNERWLKKGQKASLAAIGGEQSIDVAYTIMTLSKFCEVFRNEDYGEQMVTAFNWYLGNNRLHQIIYNPGTGRCYDGIGNTHVNLNQGAAAMVGYLMARLTIEEYLNV